MHPRNVNYLAAESLKDWRKSKKPTKRNKDHRNSIDDAKIHYFAPPEGME
jgi:hypothetical protein